MSEEPTPAGEVEDAPESGGRPDLFGTAWDWTKSVAIAFICLALSAVAPRVAQPNLVIALAFALSWAAACFRYRSCAEPGWIEVLGRVFAVGLIVTIAVSYS